MLASLATDDKGTFQLTPNGHFHHWPWGPCSRTQAKQGFVGKQTRDLMHVACNDTGWYVAAPNRLSFHTLVTGASFPTAKLLAITKLGYPISGVRSLAGWLASEDRGLPTRSQPLLVARQAERRQVQAVGHRCRQLQRHCRSRCAAGPRGDRARGTRHGDDQQGGRIRHPAVPRTASETDPIVGTWAPVNARYRPDGAKMSPDTSRRLKVVACGAGHRWQNGNRWSTPTSAKRLPARRSLTARA